MGYEYENLKPELFTDGGQRRFLKVRDYVGRMIAEAGAIRMDSVLGKIGGDSWSVMACVDRMVELTELTEVGTTKETPGQYRLFTNYRK